jgi:hypothetical protein
MIYREYGKTGKKISVLGLGGLRFPAELATTQEGRERCAEIVVKAHQLGINYFDTAPTYIGGHSEEIYGMAFRHMTGDFFVSDKSRLSTDPDADSVRRRIESSLKKLGIDKIPFYHMWCVLNLNDFWKIMAPGGPYDGALKAKQEGLIDHICVSTHCSGDEIETIINTGAFEGITLGYNLINAEFRSKGIESAREKNIGVSIMNPLAGGVLPNNKELFKGYCEENESVVDAALRFVIMTPGVTCALAGASSMSELLEDIDSVNKLELRRTINDVKANAKKFAKQFNDLCTGCGYCSGCPAGIEINKLMLSYNQTLLVGENPQEPLAALDRMQEWWELSKTKNYPCLKCGSCEIKCTQHLPIIRRIESINTITKRNRLMAKEYLLKLFDGCNRIGVYGSGALADRFFEECKDCEVLPTKSLHFFDSNPAKWNTNTSFGAIIEPPSCISKSGINRLIICVGSKDAYEAILQSLKKLHLADITFAKYTQVCK